MTKNNLPKSKSASKKPRIVITMDDGLVQNIQSDTPDLEIVVLDYDSEGADLDECISKEIALKVFEGLSDVGYNYHLVD